MKKIAFLTGIAFVLFSCNSGNKESSDRNKINSKSYDCLKKFEEDYAQLLTKEEMASIYPIDFDKSKVELRSGSYGQHMYRWPSNRPDFDLEISGMKMKNPDQNTMGVKRLSFYSDKSDLKSTIETFNMGYKELSEEELARIQANLDKQSDEVKETGKDLMKVRGKRSWDFVEGLGSSAWYKWNEKYGGELAVLAGKANFNIIIKTSSDPNENRELAVKLAEKVLEKCK
ncbi:MAG: hypothetical protein ABI295_06355 [Xanthomarina sp.]